MADYRDGVGRWRNTGGFVAVDSNILQPQLQWLQEIYAALDNADAVIGVAAVRERTQIDEEAVDHEISGRWSAALSCYERALLNKSSDRLGYHRGLLKCLEQLGHLEAIIAHASGAIAGHADWEAALNVHRVRAAWRLCEWDQLEHFLQRPCEQDFDVSLAQLLLSVRHNDRDTFQRKLAAARLMAMAPLAAATISGSSYQRSYPAIVQLHMLRELEQCFDAGEVSATLHQGHVPKDWDRRLRMTQPFYRAREPLLHLRHALLDLSGTDAAAPARDQCMLLLARTARKEQLYSAAYSALLRVQPGEGLRERAKVLWQQGDYLSAQLELHRLMHQQPDTGATDPAASERTKERARTYLLAAKWRRETGQAQVKEVIRLYDAANRLYSADGKGYFLLATYYEDILKNPESSCEPVPSVYQKLLSNYGHALELDHTYIYQALPRLLTLWLDRTADLVSDSGRNGRNAGEALASKASGAGAVTTSGPGSGGGGGPAGQGHVQDVGTEIGSYNELMLTHLARLPVYEWLIVFSQLVSRICHPNLEVQNVLQRIIVKVIHAYAPQALWQMMAVCHSGNAVRKERILAILNEATTSQPDLRPLVQQWMSLTEQLLNVCNYRVTKQDTTLSVARHFPYLQKLTFNKVMLPLQRALTGTLPTSAEQHRTHRPFPDQLATIVRIEDTITVISSLAQPRKIQIHASDGGIYVFLCKPNDDLRKDCRMMEFNGMLNYILRRAPDGQRRQLCVRTYAVVPLNDQCGLIEWVSRTEGLRSILTRLYKARGLYLGTHQVLALVSNSSRQTLEPASDFKNRVLPCFPPLFHEWFLQTFPLPARWYAARQAYARTCAVMSVVGYIVGLGDRHGENILLDSRTGDCVHVDFSCLFLRGQTLNVPECVPFRLTHNMVDALGLTGYEGVFRRSCEVTLRLLQQNQLSLLSALHTFIHDPLVEWDTPMTRREGANTTAGAAAAAAGRGAEKGGRARARRTLDDVEKRLWHRMAGTLSLSVEGQVDQLIREATDPDRLARMYIGWAAHM